MTEQGIITPQNGKETRFQATEVVRRRLQQVIWSSYRNHKMILAAFLNEIKDRDITELANETYPSPDGDVAFKMYANLAGFAQFELAQRSIDDPSLLRTGYYLMSQHLRDSLKKHLFTDYEQTFLLPECDYLTYERIVGHSTTKTVFYRFEDSPATVSQEVTNNRDRSQRLAVHITPDGSQVSVTQSQELPHRAARETITAQRKYVFPAEIPPGELEYVLAASSITHGLISTRPPIREEDLQELAPIQFQFPDRFPVFPLFDRMEKGQFATPPSGVI